MAFFHALGKELVWKHKLYMKVSLSTSKINAGLSIFVESKGIADDLMILISLK